MNLGVVDVTLKLLEESLNLPEGHRIVRVFPSRPEIHNDQVVSIMIDGPHMPYCPEGQRVKKVTPSLQEGKVSWIDCLVEDAT